MRIRRAVTILVSLALGAGLLVPSASAFAEQAAEELMVQGLDTSEFPRVTFSVIVPSALANADKIDFAIKENGRGVQEVEAHRLSGDAAPATVVLLIDVSGSMAGSPMADAKAAARTFVQELGEGAQVGIVSFADKVSVMSMPGEDPEAALSRLDGMQAHGETALYDAVTKAADMMPKQADGQRAIVVLSDGGDTVSSAGFEKAVSAVRSVGVPVYAVALRSGEYNPQALRTMSRTTSGRLIPVTKSAALAGSFESIAQEISEAYFVSYTSNRARTKDIDLDIAASAGGLKANAMLAYGNPRYSWSPDDAESGSIRTVAPNKAALALSTVLAFVSVGLLAFGGLTLLARERARLGDLKFYDQLKAQGDDRGSGVADQVRDRVVDAVEQVASRRGFTEVIGLKLEQAGLPLRPAEYIAAHVISVVVLGTTAQLLMGSFFISIVLVLAASFGPLMVLDVTIENRRRRFEDQLPDVLAMIASSLRGGWGLLQAVDFVVEQAGPPASTEFRRVQTETRLGMTLEVALQNMARRIGSGDFDAAVSAIIIQREVGGNLAEVLDIVAQTVRDRASLARHVKALTAEGRLSAWILIALPFIEAVVLSLVNPGYLNSLTTTLPGVVMSVGAIVLLVIGSIWLRAITRIEV